MKEFDTLLNELEIIVELHTQFKRGEFYINDKKSMAYEIFNLVEKYDKSFIKRLTQKQLI